MISLFHLFNGKIIRQKKLQKSVCQTSEWKLILNMFWFFYCLATFMNSEEMILWCQKNWKTSATSGNYII